MKSTNKKKLSYFNCTANQAHIGCYAVTDAHFRMLLKNGYDIIHISPLNALEKFNTKIKSSTIANIENSYIKDILQKSDAIVINGEGTIHHGSGTVLLCLAQAAINLKKPVFLVNAVIEEVEGYDDILKKITDINVREIRSSNYLTKKNIKHRIVLDSILEADFTKTKTLDFQNKIVFTDWHKERDHDIGKQITQYERTNRHNIVYFPIQHMYHIKNTNWKGIISSLSEAKLVITGRHHGVYLAGLAGVPLVALPSNTYKVEGTLEMSPVEIAFCKPTDILEEKINYALSNPDIAKKFQTFLKSQLPLHTFNKLYELLPSSTNISILEIDEKIKKYFTELIHLTDLNEIKTSYLTLQSRVHNINKINNLIVKHDKHIGKINLLDDRISKLQKIKLKLETSNKILKDRYKILHTNFLSTREQLALRNLKIKELNKVYLQNKQLVQSNLIYLEEENNILINNFMYKEWLIKNENSALTSTDTKIKLNLAIAYHGTLKFNNAINIWLSLVNTSEKIAYKNLARIYIELNILDSCTKVFESWNEKFALLLAKLKYDEAWNYLLKRPYSQTLIKKNKHLIVNKHTSETILVIPDGGIGDEIRNSIIYTEVLKKYSNILIACNKRLYNFFKYNFPDYQFIIYDKELENKYNVLCPVYDLFHQFSPFNNNNFLKANNLLLNYWQKYFIEISQNKKIIGICQGTHIHSFDRMSNIYEYELWVKYLNSKYLFVNLSFDYKDKCKNILMLPINYRDDFDSLAAVISCCDCIITPPNTILDLSGSLNKKTIALYSGYKFKWRMNKNGYDLIHSNTKWIGTNEINNKDKTLKMAFSYLSEFV